MHTKPWTPGGWKKLRDELRRLLAPTGAIPGFKIITRVEGAAAPDKWESGKVQSLFTADDVYKYVFTLNKKGDLVWSLTRPKGLARELNMRTVRSGTGTQPNIFGFVSGTFYYLPSSRAIIGQGYKAGVGIYLETVSSLSHMVARIMTG